ncbi:hypothetical protein Tdes44962_MAKER06248 [Teratosphaeria destructans]|uniref:Uncharacterized protein n=1 Tax=Teratosphaeria destructans TaxID=418781 RepID=A0A9W7SHS5_9PEZI|nr:hypothetical protein Tdes44962_MAKER06248 [Teratosphaeria destructans]
MKLTAFALLSLTLTAPALAKKKKDNRTNQQKCADKKKWGSGCVKAIEDFCNHENIMTPSTFADEGTQANVNGYKDVWCYAYIDSTCSPPVSLPKDVCFDQWWYQCQAADQYNGMYREVEYGPNACQKWQFGLTGNEAKFTSVVGGFKKRGVNGTGVEDLEEMNEEEVGEEEEVEEEEEEEEEDGEL